MRLSFDELYKSGCDLLLKGDVNSLVEAERIFNTLLADFPTQSSLWFQLGCVQLKKGFFFAAELFFLKVLAFNENKLEALNNLAFICFNTERNAESREYYEKVIAEAPDNAQYLCNYSSAFVAAGEADKCIEICEKVLELDPTIKEAKNNIALAYLEKGNYKDGFYYYNFRSTTYGGERNFSSERTIPLWEGQKNKLVVVYGEQGIGDEIMFASIIRELAQDVRIIFDAHPRLANLFRHSFTDLHIPIYGTRKNEGLYWPQFHKDIDYKISLMSLGHFYRSEQQLFEKAAAPYIKSDPTFAPIVKPFVEKLNKKLKIGISWQGGVTTTGRAARILPLKEWMPIFNSVDADFVSLQYHANAQTELDDFNNEFPDVVIHHWQDIIDDYDLTASLLDNLDLIISVPQSIVHLAGSMGKETLQLCPKHGLWQMGVYGEDAPWYPSVKNIWQDIQGDWTPVVKKVVDKLCAI